MSSVLRSSSRAEAGRSVRRPIAQAHVVLHQLRALVDQVRAQEAHQVAHFRIGALPVVDREGVQRQALDAHARALLGDLAHGLDAFLVPEDAPQSAALGPASVAVHDHGDVRRERAAQLGATSGTRR
jgi:hypothetical protein